MELKDFFDFVNTPQERKGMKTDARIEINF